MKKSHLFKKYDIHAVNAFYCPICGSSNPANDSARDVFICRDCGHEGPKDSWVIDITSDLETPDTMMDYLANYGALKIFEIYKYWEDAGLLVAQIIDAYEILESGPEEGAFFADDFEIGAKNQIYFLESSFWNHIYPVYARVKGEITKEAWFTETLFQLLPAKYHDSVTVVKLRDIPYLSVRSFSFCGLMQPGGGIRVIIHVIRKEKSWQLYYQPMEVISQDNFAQVYEEIMAETEDPTAILRFSKPEEGWGEGQTELGKAVFMAMSSAIKLGRYKEAYQEARRHCAEIALKKAIGAHDFGDDFPW